MDPQSVYKKNNIAARTLRCREPQMPIRKNIGIKIPSKKIKNVTISRDANDRIKNSSNKIKLKQ